MTTKVTITADKLCQPGVAVSVTVTQCGVKREPQILRQGESAEVYVFDTQSVEVGEIKVSQDQGDEPKAIAEKV